jgi:hypothetical protein
LVRTAGLEPAAFGSVDRRSDPTELRAHADREYTRKRREGGTVAWMGGAASVRRMEEAGGEAGIRTREGG